MRICVHPNLVMISSNMKHAVVVALQSLTSLAYAHLVKYFVAVMIYLASMHFLGGFIGPTKSMAHFSNDCNIIWGANDISSLLEGFPILWHTSQDL
jgi:hypothetical protein